MGPCCCLNPDDDEVVDIPPDGLPKVRAVNHLVASAPNGQLGTVEEMQPLSSIHKREQIKRTMGALGRIGDEASSQAPREANQAPLGFLNPRPNRSLVRFRQSPVLCTVDRSGRIRVPGTTDSYMNEDHTHLRMSRTPNRIQDTPRQPRQRITATLVLVQIPAEAQDDPIRSSSDN